MKKILLVLSSMLLLMSVAMSQTIILDFEDAATSTDFQFFGGNLEGALSQNIANPDASGINTSSTVCEFKKASDAPEWGGGFTNPDPATSIDLTTGAEICLDVWMDHIGNVAVKLEGSGTGDNWILTKDNTTMNAWERICYDVSLPSIEDPFTSAAGHIYSRVVLFMDFGTAGTGTEAISYVDNITVNAAPVCTTSLDWEDPSTGTDFQFFGGNLEGQMGATIDNPNASGINTSAKVYEFKKASDAPEWGGGFTNPDPTTPFDLTSGLEVCVDVHMDHIGVVALKLEGSSTGGPNWILSQENTVMNDWEQLCYDVSMASIEDPFMPAVGHIYNRLVLFFDFGTAGTGTEAIYYVDNALTKSTPGDPDPINVTFQVDMNNYSGDPADVYIRGTFNGFDESNPMTDIGSGLWETTIELMPGAIEYKFWVSGEDVWEEFTGLEECVTPPGNYVNRTYAVSGDATVGPVAWNSCYAAGQEAMLTFELGTDNITPSPDGIWLAGGGNFEAPGGKYQMSDSDGDGIYTISFPRGKGFSSFYTFANGNCPDFSCKEDIAGQSCADPDNFNDRFLAEVTGDVTVSTCFGMCTDMASMCTVGTNDLTVVDNLFDMNPTLVTDQTLITFNESNQQDRQLTIVSSLGETLINQSIDGAILNKEIRAGQLAAGIYFVQVQQGQEIQTTKFLVF